MALLKASVLNGRKEVEDINNTSIMLIPKVNDPDSMSQFRPISVCNVVYKIISKVVVNRFRTVLTIVLMKHKWHLFRVLHSLKQKRDGPQGHFALKLDISKAYDRME
ncbi:reverse transcriptase [Gossypium australe]|uniref:Reverse transcriptase n=1 Tax=Gossypium australe TaxID=47621 RepID=A0A5B6X0R2_9ROSI|nr:reverse transcriptase [Gossypium australe]